MVIITDKAQEQLKGYIRYILDKFGSEQAVEAVWNDAKETKEELARVAGNIGYMKNPKFKGYKRINFRKHRYSMIYRVDEENHIAYVERVFHQLEDIDNKFE